MVNSGMPGSDDVEQLLLNAQLRTELEPYIDDSLSMLDLHRLPTRLENEYLASMLAWERAPILPIAKWFEPELRLPSPDSLTDMQLSRLLGETIERLYDKHIVLEFTEHLNDRELYAVIYRDILPSYEKKVDLPKNYLHWHCLDDAEDPSTWLRYYATDEERAGWAETNDEDLPPAEEPPFPRKMPRRPR